MASGERIQNQYQQYIKALNTLEEAIDLEINANVDNDKLKKALRDACIQRFEYTFEVLWKLLKHIAEFKGYRCDSPREAFKTGFKIEIIKEEFESVFLDMIEKRNLTTHTYKEQTAVEIYEFISNKALPAFQSVLKQLEIQL